MFFFFTPKPNSHEAFELARALLCLPLFFAQDVSAFVQPSKELQRLKRKLSPSPSLISFVASALSCRSPCPSSSGTSRIRTLTRPAPCKSVLHMTMQVRRGDIIDSGCLNFTPHLHRLPLPDALDREAGGRDDHS